MKLARTIAEHGYPVIADGPFVGRYCGYPVDCTRSARYCVTPYGLEPASDGKAVCGQHLGFTVVEIWTEHNIPAIVQEIPVRRRAKGVKT